MEEAVSKRRKAFAATHKSDEDRQAYISTFPHGSSAIAEAKADAWQATYSYLSISFKSSSKFVYRLLRSVAGSSSSSLSSFNFSNCFSSRESASVFADYLKSHISVSLPKALRSWVRGYLSELRQATCPEESYLSFCYPLLPRKIFCDCHWPG